MEKKGIGNLESLLNTLQKIKKKQEIIKKELGNIKKFIKTKFNQQKKEKENKFNEFSTNINKELEYQLEIITKNIILKNESNSKKIPKKDKDVETYKSIIIEPDQKYQFEDSKNEEEENILSKNNIFQSQIVDDDKNENYSLEFLSEDIIKEIDINHLEQLNRINFNVKIKNDGELRIPKGTFITLENKVIKLEFVIDELGMSEEKDYNITILFNDEVKKVIKKNLKYESNLIFGNDNYKIQFQPIKFILIIKIPQNQDNSSDNTIENEENFRIPSQKDENEKKDENIKDENKNNSKKDIDPYEDMENDQTINIDDEDFNKIKNELSICYNLSNFKNDNYLKKKISKFKQEYQNYKNEKNNEKEKLFEELCSKIGEEFMAESIKDN